MSEKQVTSDSAKKDTPENSPSVEPSTATDNNSINLSAFEKLVTKLGGLAIKEKKGMA